MEESVTYQAILRKGRAEGLAEAKAELEAEGRIEGWRRGLLRVGRKRFGPPEPQTIAAFEAIADLGQLERLADRLFDVSSWDEWLATPS